MTIDRDPALESLFADADQNLAGDTFTAAVMTQVDSQRRRIVYGWIGICLALFASALLLSAPLQNAVNLLTQILPVSLIDLGDQWLAQVLAPVNSVATPIGLGILALWTACRKLFS